METQAVSAELDESADEMKSKRQDMTAKGRRKRWNMGSLFR